MSAHSLPSRRGWLAAVVAQLADYVFEEVDEIAPAPVMLEPRPVIAVVSAAPKSGASTVARLLAAEMAGRADGAVALMTPALQRRPAPPSRAAIRLATALAGAAVAQPCGRLCLVAGPTLRANGSATRANGTPARANGTPARDPADLADSADLARPAVDAARYLAPVVIDLPPDGSAAGIGAIADRVLVVGSGAGEPALIDAVAHVIGGDPIKVANRVAEAEGWADRVQFALPDSRIAARAAALGTRALGELGAGIAAIADALEVPR